MIYRVSHTTTYRYAQPVSLCHNVAHLTPRSTPWQRCHDIELRIEPEPAILHESTDYFGNGVTYFTIQEPHTELVVRADHTTEVNRVAAPDPLATAAWETVRGRLVSDRRADFLDAYQFTFDSTYVAASPDLRQYAVPSFPPGRPVLDAALDLTRRIHAEFAYDPRATDVSTRLADVLAGMRGVCQDFAHFQVGCLRSLGLAARYVSGYLRTLPPAGKPRLVGADASHAWLSVFCGDHGWVDLDPTNGVIPSDEHILLTWGRDYDDVSPVKGVILGGGSHQIAVSVDVEGVG